MLKKVSGPFCESAGQLGKALVALGNHRKVSGSIGKLNICIGEARQVEKTFFRKRLYGILDFLEVFVRDYSGDNLFCFITIKINLHKLYKMTRQMSNSMKRKRAFGLA